jgi:hypothetical protein
VTDPNRAAVRDVVLYCESCGRKVRLDTNGTSTGKLCVCGGARVRGMVAFTPTESGDLHIGGLEESDPRGATNRQYVRCEYCTRERHAADVFWHADDRAWYCNEIFACEHRRYLLELRGELE